MAGVTAAYIKWLLLTVCAIAMDIANLFLAPLAVPLASDDGWLPGWLSWLQTPDNSLDGDNGWRTEHLLPLNRHGTPLDPVRRYLKRVLWLYRNSMYGFAIDVLGARCDVGDRMLLKGDAITSNRPGHSGLVRRVLSRNHAPIYWQWYYVRQWGSSSRCIRINLGWKLWGFGGSPAILQHVCSINPFMSFDQPIPVAESCKC